MNVNQVVARFPEILERCKTEAVFVVSKGQRLAVIISYERYDQLMCALEDLEDLEAIDTAERDIELHGTIPWEEVKRELGY